MQQFFVDYGLWLLLALLVVIVLVFLLSGRKPAAPPAEASAREDVQAEIIPAPTIVPVPPVSLVNEPVTPVTTAPAAPPATARAPAPASDNLLLLKGVGPKLSNLLVELGVTSFAQIAAWNDADVAAIDARLGNFKGRPVRDQWIDQAKYLAAGDTAGFEAKYGKI